MSASMEASVNTIYIGQKSLERRSTCVYIGKETESRDRS